jgi:hypothetical protein
LIPPEALTDFAHAWITSMLLPTADASGPVQLQIIPTTIAFPLGPVTLELDAGVALAAGLELFEALEPQALSATTIAATADDSSSRPVTFE